MMASNEALLQQSQPVGGSGFARRPKSKAFLDDDDIVMVKSSLALRCELRTHNLRCHDEFSATFLHR
jgi:hypothetical protein